jgi:hypothetical protein
VTCFAVKPDPRRRAGGDALGRRSLRLPQFAVAIAPIIDGLKVDPLKVRVNGWETDLLQ